MTAEPTTDRVTLSAVAAASGLSLSTISKVLNGRSDVSRETKDRVEAELARQGYSRRRAPGNASQLLELVFHDMDSEYAMEIIRGVESVASGRGLSVTITHAGGEQPGEDWVDGVMQRRPVGAVLVFSELTDDMRARLDLRSIPFVVVDPAGDPGDGVPFVGSGNWSGGVAATRHLLELGHQRIAVITGPADVMCARARVDGFRSAMSVAGVDVREDWVRYGNFHVDSGREQARALLAGDDRPTAIFAGNDLQALGVLETARELGLAVPADLSIVGYDDISVASWVSPALTTIHQPLQRMGEEAARLVLSMADGDFDAPSRLDLATTLVVRASTAPPPTTEKS